MHGRQPLDALHARAAAELLLELSEQISVVDAQAVQDVAAKYLVPEKFVVVPSATASKIGRSSRKSCRATADVRDPDGQPVK